MIYGMPSQGGWCFGDWIDERMNADTTTMTMILIMEMRMRTTSVEEIGSARQRREKAE